MLKHRQEKSHSSEVMLEVLHGLRDSVDQRSTIYIYINIYIYICSKLQSVANAADIKHLEVADRTLQEMMKISIAGLYFKSWCV